MKYIKLFEKFNESIYIGTDGSLNYPDYLISDMDDDINIAYEKGIEAKDNDCDIDENPYIDVHPDLKQAWEDGYMAY